MFLSKKQLIYNALIYNEGRNFRGAVLIDNDKIADIFEGDVDVAAFDAECIDAELKMLLPGVIDDQVHFREPGLTHKADIFTESTAAAAGGVTSFMEMPNTMPLTTTIDILEDKYRIGASQSVVNYSFYMGATNENLAELKKLDPKTVCGVKVFMGSSTGNMLVDNVKTLSGIFAEVPMLITTHCEDEATINQNKAFYKEKYGDDLDVTYHPLIRNAEACYRSSSFAVELAHKYNARLHVLHISTAREMALFDNKLPLIEKKVTAEVCVHHLWFNDKDYARYGNRIKWNPAIKFESDRLALIDALVTNKIDVVATDHAPHLLREKEGSCFKAASGGPLIQYSLLTMLQMAKRGYFDYHMVVRKMCHAPADLYRVEKRGYLRKGYFADFVLVDCNRPTHVNTESILSKCAWSPFEGESFDFKVAGTWVNGHKVYDGNAVDTNYRGRRLSFLY